MKYVIIGRGIKGVGNLIVWVPGWWNKAHFSLSLLFYLKKLHIAIETASLYHKSNPTTTKTVNILWKYCRIYSMVRQYWGVIPSGKSVNALIKAAYMPLTLNISNCSFFWLIDTKFSFSNNSLNWEVLSLYEILIALSCILFILLSIFLSSKIHIRGQ